MFESGDRLRTWATDLPLAPNVDLPARRLDDHRLAYLDYEGPISGGRGEVRAVDRGSYAIETWESTTVRVHLEGHQLAGVLELRKVDSVELSRTLDRWTLRFFGKLA